jgi:hypothetical protein
VRGVVPNGAHMNVSELPHAATTPVEDYNPAHVIAAVNALQPLGKQAALEQIETFLRTRDHACYPFGLLWVLRVLFDLPPGHGFPPVRIGRPSIPPPDDPGTLPRFPIVLVRDVPFLAVRGYDLAGTPEAVEVHVAYFRDHGAIRTRPLTQPPSLAGIEEEFLRVWNAAYGDAYAAQVLETITAQCARLRGPA